jgi:D-arabinose 1-dehydrogenase-like Zn-dependent alcohol dehydrogenase
VRAAVITKFEEPWELKEVPDPRPGPGQVVVRIHASGLCGTDLHAHHGRLGGTVPMVPGHEPAGEIVELGVGVLDLKVGDRVGAFWNQKGCGRCASCQSGLPGHCPNAQSWMHIGGSHAELMLAWASGCELIPDGLAYELAAPIFCGGYTVMSGLRNGDPKPGERVAVLGLGGLGHMALQLAKAVGLETVAVTGRAEKKAELVAMGADEVVVAGDDPGAALRAAGGADVILSTTNSSKQISAAFAGLRPQGRLVNMGVPDAPLVIDHRVLMWGQRQLRGSSQDERADLYQALQLTAAGKVTPKVELYPLARANEARERLGAGKVRYRAVLQPGRD